MLFSTSYVLLLLLGLSKRMVTFVTADCIADNCLRALRATATPGRLASASSFCQRFTLGAQTATSLIPTYAASPCSTNISKVSSACSCLPTPTGCPTTVVQNGGFESGALSPWLAYNEDYSPNVPGSWGLTSPGYTGNYQFRVDFTNIRYITTIALQQNIKTCNGTTYEVAITYKFEKDPQPGYPLLILGYVNGGSVLRIEAGNPLPAQQYHRATARFTEPFDPGPFHDDKGKVKFWFEADQANKGLMYIDDISITPVV